MKRMTKTISILLALLLLCGVFTTVPLSASAAKADIASVGESYDEGYSAGYSDYSDGGYGATSNPYSYEDEYDLFEQWESGYSAGWDDAENNNPNSYQDGYTAGYDAGYDDYPNFENTPCDNPDDPDYYEGWSSGYSAGWAAAMAEDPGAQYTYSDGYNDGQDAALEDYSNYGRPDGIGVSTCPHPENADYSDGWAAGYQAGWLAIYNNYELGYEDGFAAADYDFNHGNPKNTTQPDERLTSLSNYMDGWNYGYDFEWEECVFFNDYSYVLVKVTNDNSVYGYDYYQQELIFIYGTFDRKFYEKEFAETFSGYPISKISARYASSFDDPNTYLLPDEMTDSNIGMSDIPDFIRFKGDCSYMFSNENIRTNCNLVDLSIVDTTEVTDMSYMFYDCDQLMYVDMSGCDTSNVSNFVGAFFDCGDLVHVDLSSFSTASVENAEFYGIEVPGTFGMFANSNAIYCLFVPSCAEITPDMLLYNPEYNDAEHEGWVSSESKGVKVSTGFVAEYFSTEFHCVDIPAADPASDEPIFYGRKSVEDEYDWFTGYTVTTDGDIGLSFFLDMPIINDSFHHAFDDLFQVQFEWEGKTETYTVTPADVEEVETEYGSRYLVKVTCRVAAAEMTSNIHASLLYNGFSVDGWIEDDYCVRDYAMRIINAAPNTYDNQEALVNLVKEMLNYGAQAQLVFGKNTDDLANRLVDGYSMTEVTSSQIPVTATDMTANMSEYGLEYYASSLIFLTESTLRHYYRVTDREKFNAVKETLSGDYTYGERGGFIYFEKRAIAAPDLDNVYSFTLGNSTTGVTTYSYSALDFARKMIDAGTPAQNLLGQATCLYCYWANAYFG